MSVLFIDTSYDITLGLLDEGLGWFDLRTFRTQRASNTLQIETHRLLQGQNLSMKDLTGVVSIAGPGFYTGLRLSEGFADVTSFFKIPHWSFYSYEIPQWLGHGSGFWITKAYRGEYFIHEWSEGVKKTRLLDTQKLGEFQPTSQAFIHSETALDEKLLRITSSAVSTLELLRKESKVVFSKVIEAKLKRESYYFRAPEDEFRMNP